MRRILWPKRRVSWFGGAPTPPVQLILALGCLVACGTAGHEAGTAAGRWAEGAPNGLKERGQVGLRAPGDLGASWSEKEGAKVLPDGIGKGQAHGIGPDGGTRVLVGGLRVLAFPDGSVLSAQDHFASTPSSVVPVPDRLGGGFVFALDRRVWRSDSWLGKAAGVITAPWPIERIVIGLDRMYLRSQQGALMALVAPSDPGGRWMLSRDLGPLPAGPHSGRLAATDAWHAAALGDLQGVLVTNNAGSSWTRVPLPIAPADVQAQGEALLVGGAEVARRSAEWWQLGPEGQSVKVRAPEHDEAAKPPDHGDLGAHPFGPVPLRAALEDGYPLVDGTALVLRDGAMGRVRLSDGKLVELVTDAFPLKPSRCHPLSLASMADEASAGAFGFVCGEPRGRTVVYRWEPALGRPVEVRRFAEPRQVLAFGNGALAARGPCAETAPHDASTDTQTYCVMPPRGAWHQLSFRGDDAERARLVVLGDGRAVVVRPPVGGDLSAARLAFVDDSRAAEVTLSMPPLGAPVSRVLREGIWRDGFEERRPGLLGGWVDDADAVLGVEISIQGQVKVGEDLEDATVPFVSGRWGLTWTASKRGYETTDGGMTWRGDIQLPEPLVKAPAEGACGPIGCIAAGWLRLGWGRSGQSTAEDPPPSWRTSLRPAIALSLDCTPSTPVAPSEDAAAAPGGPSAMRRVGANAPTRDPSSRPPVMPPLGTHKGPRIPNGAAGVSAESRVALQRTQHGEEFARIYAWGPSSGDWDLGGRWQVLWQWPWGAWTDVRSSAEAAAGWTTVDAARQALGIGAPIEWSLTVDDAEHALLAGRRVYGAARTDLLVVESSRPPLEVRTSGGDPLADIDGAVRLAGHWYLATGASSGEPPSAVVWVVDGATAREIARLPRLGIEPRSPVRLASRGDGRTLGVVVDGEASDGASAERWVFPIDAETGTLGEPELLGAANLGDRTSLGPCTGEDAGWELEQAYPGSVQVRVGPYRTYLQSPYLRMRVSRGAACVERVLGSVEPWAARPPEALTNKGGGTGLAGANRTSREIDVSVLSARSRYLLRCAHL